MLIDESARRSPGISDEDRALIDAVGKGLPIVSRPYAAIAEKLGCSEHDVITRLQRLIDNDVIKRYGVVVRHKELGYTANGMVVWDVPDEKVDELGVCIGKYACVTLCYRRPRRLPGWPYNLFTMVHGCNRQEVSQKVEEIIANCDLQDINHDILFSTRRFKQRGARYTESARSGPDRAAGLADKERIHLELIQEPAHGQVKHDAS